MPNASTQARSDGAGLSSPTRAATRVELDELPLVSLVRANHRRRYKFVEPPVNIESLSGTVPHSRMSVMLKALERGAIAAGDVNPHEGEEFILVRKGTLEVYVEEERHILKEGDSIHYKATKPHAMRNIGDAKCRAIWITLPPYSL